ncbi:hypothetical protein QNY79_000312 [Neisseria gonorrhoeae]|nr:hypothetical protein N776_06210 [Neisseria gonorrhoeae 3502]CNQ12452.1 putative phage associated protein [Neisseria gonorrhoeae]CNR87498.1 putative phage associated protein [Neisseria gonorrhoeae]SBN15059.1 putative phage associated protein [Neisseria gonorrhoeae]
MLAAKRAAKESTRQERAVKRAGTVKNVDRNRLSARSKAQKENIARMLSGAKVSEDEALTCGIMMRLVAAKVRRYCGEHPGVFDGAAGSRQLERYIKPSEFHAVEIQPEACKALLQNYPAAAGNLGRRKQKKPRVRKRISPSRMARPNRKQSERRMGKGAKLKYRTN